MARTPRPLYMVAFGGYNDFESLLASGDASAMRVMIARSEKYLQDPDNANDPWSGEERARLHQIKAELAELEASELVTAVA